MKKISLFLVLCLIIVACFVNYTFRRVLHFKSNHTISIHVKENGDVYQLSALYNREKTGRLQRYIDAQLNTNHLFQNSRMDATVTLDDKTNFYVKTSPGSLLIKLDKNTNEPASYYRIKELGEHIKQKLTNNE